MWWFIIWNHLNSLACFNGSDNKTCINTAPMELQDSNTESKASEREERVGKPMDPEICFGIARFKTLFCSSITKLT